MTQAQNKLSGAVRIVRIAVRIVRIAADLFETVKAHYYIEIRIYHSKYCYRIIVYIL